MEGLASIWETMRLAAVRARSTAPDQYEARYFCLAGMPVKINFVGLELCKRLTRSMMHLEVPEFEDSVARLRIDLWDGTQSGVGRPFCDLRDAAPETSQFGDGILAGATGDTLIGHQSPRCATVIDLVRGHAVGWVSSFDQLSWHETGKPLQPILFAWYCMQGVQPVHAGLVARSESGVLIGGAGGSGKSTTSLLCAQAGFSYLADDYVGLPAPAHGDQQAYSLYASLWLEPEHSTRFRGLSPHIMEGQQASDLKLPFAVGKALPGSLATSCTVRAIVLPRVAHRPFSTVRPATSAEALLRLAPSSVLQLPFIQPATALERMASLVRQVPSFWLDLGTDFDTIPTLVDQALEISVSQVAS